MLYTVKELRSFTCSYDRIASPSQSGTARMNWFVSCRTTGSHVVMAPHSFSHSHSQCAVSTHCNRIYTRYRRTPSLLTHRVQYYHRLIFRCRIVGRFNFLLFHIVHILRYATQANSHQLTPPLAYVPVIPIQQLPSNYSNVTSHLYSLSYLPSSCEQEAYLPLSVSLALSLYKRFAPTHRQRFTIPCSPRHLGYLLSMPARYTLPIHTHNNTLNYLFQTPNFYPLSLTTIYPNISSHSTLSILHEPRNFFISPVFLTRYSYNKRKNLSYIRDL